MLEKVFSDKPNFYLKNNIVSKNEYSGYNIFNDIKVIYDKLLKKLLEKGIIDSNDQKKRKDHFSQIMDNLKSKEYAVKLLYDPFLKILDTSFIITDVVTRQLAKFENFIIQCDEGMAQELEKICKNLYNIIDSQPLNEVMFDELRNQFSDYNGATRFFDNDGVNLQHVSTNVFNFLKKHNLFQQNESYHDVHNAFGDEFILNLYYFLLVEYSSPEQQLQFLFDAMDVQTPSNAEEKYSLNDIISYRNAVNSKFDLYIKNKKISKLIFDLNYWLETHKYMDEIQDPIKMKLNFNQKYFYKDNDGFYYDLNHNNAFEDDVAVLLPPQILIYVPNELSSFKDQNKSFYLEKYNSHKRAFTITNEAIKFDSFIKDQQYVTSIEQLKNTPMKIANFDFGVDEKKELITLDKSDESKSFFDYIIQYGDIDHISDKFSKAFQVRRLISGCELMFYKKHNSRIRFNDEQLEYLKSLPYTAILNFANFITFIYEMMEHTSYKLDSRNSERYYHPSIINMMDLFDSTNKFILFIESLMRSKFGTNMDYLMIFAQYLITLNNNKYKKSLTKLDHVYSLLSNSDEKSKRIFYQLINGNEFKANEIFLLHKIINQFYKDNKSEFDIDYYKNFAIELYSNVDLYKEIRTNTYSNNNLSNTEYFYNKFKNETLVDEIDKIKDSHRDKHNKMTLKLISINMPQWVKYIYENKSFLASLLDNPPLVAFSQLSLFNKFLITIMISGILLGIFVSASITLVMFELAAALVLIRLLDSFLNNRRKVFFDPNGTITEDFSSLSNKSCLELNKADYSFFNSKNHQEKFFIIDKDINNGEDNFSDTSSVISLN